MKSVHAMLVLMLSILLLGIVAGAAAAGSDTKVKSVSNKVTGVDLSDKIKVSPRASSLAVPSVMAKVSPKPTVKKAMKVSPKPTVKKAMKVSPKPTVKKAIAIAPRVQPRVHKTSTMGSCGCVPLYSDLRYAGRGPGMVDGMKVYPPTSAPGPNASPVAKPVARIIVVKRTK
jgi:hypothetical protein